MWKPLFQTFTFLKRKTKIKRDSNKGVTLIELLITMAIIAMVTMITISIFLIASKSYHIAEQQVESYSSGRMAYLNLERQMKKSEKIFIKDNIIYIEDLENPHKYYNYYTLVGTQIKRHKVKKESLVRIPNGCTSQFAENIAAFELTKTQENKNTFRLKISSDKDGNKLELDSLIRVGVDVIKK